MKKSKSLPSLFCHERREQIAHGRSFLKRDGSDSLTVALATLCDCEGIALDFFKKEQLSYCKSNGSD